MAVDSDELCSCCAGSGEGMHDGTVCHHCNGRGTAKSEEDYWADKVDEADYYNDRKRDEAYEEELRKMGAL